MTYSRPLLAATLTLASCGQQLQAPAPTASQPATRQPDADSEVIAGAYLAGFKQSALSAQGVTAQAIAAAGGVMTSQWADISAAAVKLSPEALNKLQHNPLVEYVEPDLVRHAMGFRSGVTDAQPAHSGGLGAQSLTSHVLTTPPYTASGEYTRGDNALATILTSSTTCRTTAPTSPAPCLSSTARAPGRAARRKAWTPTAWAASPAAPGPS